MIEYEHTYLAKYIPDDLKEHKFVEITDVYFPKEADHSFLRLRKYGDKYEITKKMPVDPNDVSAQKEDTINLTKEEFEALGKAPGKKIHKYRYFYPYQNRIAEFDIFLDDLEGLVVVEIEFNNLEEMKDYPLPDFCLVEATFENFIAAGKLSGSTYNDIKKYLDPLDYKKIS